MTQETLRPPQPAGLTPGEVAELRGRIARLEATVQTLTDRIERWASNGLDTLDGAHAFAGSGGVYGTSSRFARSDHT